MPSSEQTIFITHMSVGENIPVSKYNRFSVPTFDKKMFINIVQEYACQISDACQGSLSLWIPSFCSGLLIKLQFLLFDRGKSILFVPYYTSFRGFGFFLETFMSN